MAQRTANPRGQGWVLCEGGAARGVGVCTAIVSTAQGPDPMTPRIKLGSGVEAVQTPFNGWIQPRTDFLCQVATHKYPPDLSPPDSSGMCIVCT